jgi:hypothetical protein
LVLAAFVIVIVVLWFWALNSEPLTCWTSAALLSYKPNPYIFLMIVKS